MRFDPKLIQPDDAPLDDAGELDLPDDLAELAAQLCDDAAFLSARYPAAARDVQAPAALVAELVKPVSDVETISPWLRRYVWMAAGATSALVLVGVFGLYRSGDTATQSAVPTIAPVNALAGEQKNTIESTAPPIARVEALRTSPGKPVPSALFLNGVSGPELEGLLDLWQSDGESETRISI